MRNNPTKKRIAPRTIPMPMATPSTILLGTRTMDLNLSAFSSSSSAVSSAHMIGKISSGTFDNRVRPSILTSGILIYNNISKLLLKNTIYFTDKFDIVKTSLTQSWAKYVLRAESVPVKPLFPDFMKWFCKWPIKVQKVAYFKSGSKWPKNNSFSTFTKVSLNLWYT